MDDFDRRQESLKSVLTCGICKKLCKNVTIIEECCHRFCKKCITRKIIEEKLKVCPECKMDLGVAPLQKIRPDHQVQGIRDILSSKRREFIERGLIEKFKKDEFKKLAHEDIDLNNSADMLIDNSPSPPPPPSAPVVVATSSRRKQKSISSIVNNTPLIVDDHVSNQHNILSSITGSGSGSGRGRRRGISQNNANAISFQDPSKFNDVVNLNKGDPHPESLTIPLLSGKATQYKQQIKGDQPGSSSTPLLSGKATQHKQQVESTVYAVESSKNDSISKKNNSIEPLDGMNDLLEPLNKLVTNGVTLDNSNELSKFREPVTKFSRTPLINLDDYEDHADVDDDDDEEDEEYVPSPKVKEHKVSKQNVVQKLDVVQAIAAPSSSNNNNNSDKGKGNKGRRGRKKKGANNPPPPAGRVGDGGGGGGTNINVAQVQVTTEAAGDTSNGSTRVLNERVRPIWFVLVACDKRECSLPLPQISSRYLKIKDVNMPASYIKKYLAKKLSLQSEDEVEVRMLGMQIRPSLPLKHLAELWLRAAPNSGKFLAKVGASAQEFVMVLKYSRSHP